MPRKKREIPEAQPRDTTPPTQAAHDEEASPLGRGVDPGTAGDTYPLSESEGSISGSRGHAAPAALGGPSGQLQRANEDAAPSARRGRYPNHD